MSTVVSISPKFQIVIPKVVREAMKLQPGQKIQVIHYQNRIELVPIRPIKSARGFLRGIDTTIEREEDRL
jgi:AbrB family looped-hinge helix DNA binding protein